MSRQSARRHKGSNRQRWAREKSRTLIPPEVADVMRYWRAGGVVSSTSVWKDAVETLARERAGRTPLLFPHALGIHPQGFRDWAADDAVDTLVTLAGLQQGQETVTLPATNRRVDAGDPHPDWGRARLVARADGTGARMSPGQSYLTVAQVADRTGMHVNSIRRAIDSGHLAAVRPAGRRRVLIPTAAVDAWMRPIEAHTFPLEPARPARTLPRRPPARGSREALRAIEGGHTP